MWHSLLDVLVVYGILVLFGGSLTAVTLTWLVTMVSIEEGPMCVYGVCVRVLCVWSVCVCVHGCVLSVCVCVHECVLSVCVCVHECVCVCA